MASCAGLPPALPFVRPGEAKRKGLDHSHLPLPEITHLTPEDPLMHLLRIPPFPMSGL